MSPKPQTVPQPEPLGNDADGKIVRLGIQRDNDLMYYIKQGDVWAVPRKMPGKPAKPAYVVAAAGIVMDYERYLYYLDNDGDIARKRRAIR